MLPTSRSSVVRSMVNSSRRPSSCDGDAGFERFGVDDDLLVGAHLGLDQALHLLDHLGDPRLEILHQTLGRRFDQGTGSDFSSSTSAGVSRWGWRNSPSPPRRFLFRGGASRRGLALRGQAGGDVFGALDFLFVPGALNGASGGFSPAPRRGLPGPSGRVCCRIRRAGRKRMPPRRRRAKFLSLIT